MFNNRLSRNSEEKENPDNLEVISDPRLERLRKYELEIESMNAQTVLINEDVNWKIRSILGHKSIREKTKRSSYLR